MRNISFNDQFGVVAGIEYAPVEIWQFNINNSCSINWDWSSYLLFVADAPVLQKHRNGSGQPQWNTLESIQKQQKSYVEFVPCYVARILDIPSIPSLQILHIPVSSPLARGSHIAYFDLFNPNTWLYQL